MYIKLCVISFHYTSYYSLLSLAARNQKIVIQWIQHITNNCHNNYFHRNGHNLKIWVIFIFFSERPQFFKKVTQLWLLSQLASGICQPTWVRCLWLWWYKCKSSMTSVVEFWRQGSAGSSLLLKTQLCIILENKVIETWSYQKMSITKIILLNLYENKIRKIQIIIDIQID